MATVSSLIGGIAALLASVGVYGLAAYSVRQRRPEIGIRMALGATAGKIVRLLLTQAGRTVLLAVVVGSGFAIWASRVTEALLFGVEAGSLWVYGGAAATLVMTAAIAMIGPSLSAARVNPVETLRAE